MSIKNSAFHRGKQEVFVNYSFQAISYDGALVYLVKLERKYGLLKRISNFIPDDRNTLFTVYNR